MARQASLDRLPIRYLKGVGPARAEGLHRLGIDTVEDLLWYVPRRYEDRTHFMAIRQLIPSQVATVRARVLAKGLRRLRGGRAIVEAALGDATGIVHGRWFNQPYLAKLLRVGEELILYGRVEQRDVLHLVNPEIERTTLRADEAKPNHASAGEESLHMGRIVPIYSLTEGLSQRWFRRIVKTALADAASRMIDLLPSGIRERHQLPPVAWAIQQAHFPKGWEVLERARRRVAFEELFVMQVRLALRRARLTHREKPQRYQPDGPLTAAFLRQLPFALTGSQRQVLDELVDDLCKPTPMLRLLQGDVGCGKTVVGAFLLAVVVQSGYQAALMAPTELLAEQHHRVLAGHFDPLGVSVGLLAHGVSAEDRTRLLRQVASGSVSVVVGTHALLETAVSFHQLALVVIDEQHKFGVAQRSALVRKGHLPDVLVMTATPIPRTMALSIYGDLACSTIAELPPGRLPVHTVCLSESQRAEAYRLIRDELRQGRQGYVVYPLIDAQHRRDLKAATQMADHLQEQVFPEYRVALLHGQMRPQEQRNIMQAFVEGKVHLLVSTVVIEVGLDVPNATVMLIEHPERYGLSQLHQMRGRIGRSAYPATCIAIGEVGDEGARARLSAFGQTTDGFRLAEQDLALRGPGELLGRRQSGFLRFRVADLSRDRALLETAREEACRLVAQDPQLTASNLVRLKTQLRPLAASRHSSTR